MALTFGGATTDVVNCGTCGFGSTFSLLIWCYITTLTDARAFWACNANNSRFQLRGTAGNIELLVATSGGLDPHYRSTGGPLAINKWHCVAASYFGAGQTPAMRLYTGDLTTLLAEPSYTKTENGGGTENDNGNALVWGNSWITGSPANALQGDIATVMYWDTALAADELIAHQIHPGSWPTTGTFFNWLELGAAGTGTQPDWSGNGKNGTVTGATLASQHVPISNVFDVVSPRPWVSAGAAPAADQEVLHHAKLVDSLVLGHLVG